jgi:hypothetical protein
MPGSHRLRKVVFPFEHINALFGLMPGEIGRIQRSALLARFLASSDRNFQQLATADHFERNGFPHTVTIKSPLQIARSADGLAFDGYDDVAKLEPCLFCGAAGCYRRD